MWSHNEESYLLQGLKKWDKLFENKLFKYTTIQNE